MDNRTMEREIEALREENARLRAELAQVRHQWERELVVAKAALVTAQTEAETLRERLRAAIIRTLEADDEVFGVREEAAEALRVARAAEGR